MANRALLSLLLAVAAACACLGNASAVSASAPAQFNETLLVRPMHDGKVMLHAEFELSEFGSLGRDFTVFPKALGSVLWAYRVHALSLSLSSGRWLTDDFGYATVSDLSDDKRTAATADETQLLRKMTRVPTPVHAPHGAELWAILGDEEDELAEDEVELAARLSKNAEATMDSRQLVDSRWRKLQASLSGLFCASLHQMTALTESAPVEVFAEDMRGVAADLNGFRYATLPRESVCTENLAPFVKMLPCRAQRGLAALLDPIKLYATHYHSIQIRVRPLYTIEGDLDGWTLTQSVTVVLDPLLATGKPTWSLSQLLEAGPACACPLSSHASLHVHLPAAFPAQLGSTLDSTSSYLVTPPADVTSTFGASEHLVLSYDLKRLSGTGNSTNVISKSCPRGGMDLSVAVTPRTEDPRLRRPLAQLSLAGVMEVPVRVQRYLSASTLHSGILHVHLHNPSSKTAFEVQLFDALPWFCKVRLSTMRLTVDGPSLPAESLLSHRYTPAVQRGGPAQFYFHLLLAAGRTISISLEFDKALLSGDEYPPDVSRGFDIGSAVVRVRPAGPSSTKAEWVRLSTDGLLVLLPFPDFSMPFNVIAFTSTILAFVFGSMFNMTFSSTSEILKRVPPTAEDDDEELTMIQKIKAKWNKLLGRSKQTVPTDATPVIAAQATDATAANSTTPAAVTTQPEVVTASLATSASPLEVASSS